MADTSVQRALLRYQNTWTWPAAVRLTPAAKLHLTLQFLGLVDAEAEARLLEELATIDVRPFDLVLSMPGTFHGGIAWLGPEQSASLAQLHQQVTAAVQRAGLEANEEWSPHVTLARRAKDAVPPVSTAPVTWSVNAISLVWSIDSSYREVATWPFLLPLH